VGTGHPLPPDQEAPDAGGQAGGWGADRLAACSALPWSAGQSAEEQPQPQYPASSPYTHPSLPPLNPCPALPPPHPPGLDPTSIESLPYLWHKGRDFVKEGTPVSLMYRLATEADRKDPNAPRRSRWGRGGGGWWAADAGWGFGFGWETAAAVGEVDCQQQTSTIPPPPNKKTFPRYLWKTAGGSGGRGGGRGGGSGSGMRRKRGDDHDGARGGMEGYEEYGPAGGGDDDEMRRQRGERGGKRERRRRKRVKQLDGSYRDVDMEDAAGCSDEGGAGGSGGEGGGGSRQRQQRRGGGEAGAAAAAAPKEEDSPEAVERAVKATAERFGVPDLREILRKQQGAAGDDDRDRIDKLEGAAFEEVVPAADEEEEPAAA